MNTLDSINIKGKKYVTVSSRLQYFREHFVDYSLETEIVGEPNGICIFKAIIRDKNNRIIATGHAYEKEGSSFINKTSYIENCETSAWGRCLANFGIGVDTSVSSALEIYNAIENQEKKDFTPEDEAKKFEEEKQEIEKLKKTDSSIDIVSPRKEEYETDYKKGTCTCIGFKTKNGKYCKHILDKRIDILKEKIGDEKFFTMLGVLGFTNVEELSNKNKEDFISDLKEYLKVK